MQSNAFQSNAFQEGPGSPDNPPPGRTDLLPYSPPHLNEWLPPWWLIPQARRIGFPTPPGNPPFPGATALALLSMLVATDWVAADPLPQLPRNVAATIPVVSLPVGSQVRQEILNSWLPPDLGPVLDSNGQPYQPRNMTPPISGPPVQNPPLSRRELEQANSVYQTNWLPADPSPQYGARIVAVIPQPVAVKTPIGSRVPDAVLIAWIPPDPGPILDSNAQPYQPPGLTPPISAPLPPALRGSIVQPDAVNQWWNISPPGPTFANNQQPYGPENVTPPQSGPPVQSPPGFVQLEIVEPADQLYSWIPPWWLTVQTKGTAISGPPVQNPPVRGARVSQEVLNSWLAADPAPQSGSKLAPQPLLPAALRGSVIQPDAVNQWWNLPPPQPYQPIPFVQVQLPAAAKGPVIQPNAVDQWWSIVPPGPILDANQQPYGPPNLTPPISGPLLPALRGPVVQPSAVDQWWAIVPPGPTLDANQQPYGPPNLTPPQSGPAASSQPPPRSGIDPGILAQVWEPVSVVELQSSNAPPAGSVYVPSSNVTVLYSIVDTWFAPPPDFVPAKYKIPVSVAPSAPPLVNPAVINALISNARPQPSFVSLLKPPAPPQFVPSNPPFAQQPGTLYAVLEYDWLPPDPLPQAGPKLIPAAPAAAQVPVGSAVPQAVLGAWSVPSADPFMGMGGGNLQPLQPTRRTPPVSGPTPTNPPFPGTKVPTEVQVSWIPPPPQPIVGQQRFTSAPAATNPPFPGTKVSTEVLVSWIPPPPQPIVGQQRFTSGPAPTNPPFPGTRVPVEVSVGWIPPDPLPTLPPKLVQPGPAAPVLVNLAAVNALIVNARPLPSLVPLLRSPAPPTGPVFPPVRGSPVPLEVRLWWIPPDPLPTLWPPFNAALVPIPPKVPYVRYQVETYVAWLPPDPAFQTVRIGPPPPVPQPPPDLGTPVTVPYPVRSWWDIPPPDPLKARNLAATPSGPPPQNPPFMGGARVPLAVLIDWIPPPPQPPIATQLSAGYTLAQPLQVDPRYITYAQPRAQVTYPNPTVTVTRT